MEAEINVKSDNDIQLKDNENILKLRIKDNEGKYTGEMLVFNLEDIELPLRLQQMEEEDKKNRANLRNQFTIIDKKQDHKGKKLFSANEEAKIKAMQDFYKKEIEIYNMFLGENGVQKLEGILPKLQINADNIKQNIIKKYGNSNKRDDVIE